MTWCYVDPCACGTTRKISDYLGSEVTAGGNPLHFSYATCGESDSYSGATTCGKKTAVAAVGAAGAGAGAGDVQDVGKGLENADAEKCPADCSDNFDPEDEEGKARCDKLNE